MSPREPSLGGGKQAAKPLVILDANALHGRKPFTRTDSALLLELARTGHIRLVIPDVVLHELSRQWAERVADEGGKVSAAMITFNGTLNESEAEGIRLSAPLPAPHRSNFYQSARKLLSEKHVEVPSYGDLQLSDVLERDMSTRKPFTREGKGFRDALIWETVREVCNDIDHAPPPVLFLTNNSKDFCADAEGSALHGDLLGELPSGIDIEVVKHLKLLLEHPKIGPLAELLRVIDQKFTATHVSTLIRKALEDLQGAVPEPSIESYNDNHDVNPFRTMLHDAVFDEIFPDFGTLNHEVYRTGREDQMAIRATIEADCTLEGFVDRTMLGHSSFSYYETWNDQTIRVIEPRRAKFVLSKDFTPSTIDNVALTVDEVEEITTVTLLADQ